MKSLAKLLFLFFVSAISATELGIRTVKQPIYLHGADTDTVIRIIDVPYVTASASPEAEISAICHPFIPPSGKSWRNPHDINIASIYGITTDLVQDFNKKIPEGKVAIDASKARQPEGYPFTVEQVIDSVTTCIKLMMPPRPDDGYKLTIEVIRPVK